jgi:lipid II:glycine glycyltransferase (peptidoglycan interpeptide bridge formation enzyme)
MRWAKEHGYLVYDLGGTEPEPEGDFTGIHRFKRGFGGTLRRNILWTREKPYMRLLNPLYTYAVKLGIALRRGITCA